MSYLYLYHESQDHGVSPAPLPPSPPLPPPPSRPSAPHARPSARVSPPPMRCYVPHRRPPKPPCPLSLSLPARLLPSSRCHTWRCRVPCVRHRRNGSRHVVAATLGIVTPPRRQMPPARATTSAVVARLLTPSGHNTGVVSQRRCRARHRRCARRRRALLAVTSTAASTATASSPRLSPSSRSPPPRDRFCHGLADADALPRSALSCHRASSFRAPMPLRPGSSCRLVRLPTPSRHHAWRCRATAFAAAELLSHCRG